MNDNSDLRRQAEAKAAQSPLIFTAHSAEEIQQTIHELRVHQIELEMQNEELRLAQTELETARARYFDLYDLAPVGYCTISDKGLILEANLTAANIFGTTRAPLIDQPLAGFILKEDQEIFYRHRKTLFETREPQACELRMIRHDATTFWGRLNAAITHDTAGDSQCRVALSDITGLKQAEELLRGERTLIASVMETSPVGIITVDTSGRISFANAKAIAILGLTKAALTQTTYNAPAWQISDSNGNPFPEGQLPFTRVMSTGIAVADDQHAIQWPDGRRILLSINGVPMRDANGRVTGMVASLEDITEKRRMLDTLQRTDKLNSLGVLAGGIAHDFNNLLAGIFGYIDMAREESADEQAVRRYLGKALTVFDRAKGLTHQLLTFSKGGAPVRKTRPIGPQIRESASFALSGSPVACEYNLDDNLWLCDFDANQIGQVIDNLIINAQQAMPFSGTIVITAHNKVLVENEVPLLRPGNYIKITIADSGTGIAPELLPRIFDPFFTTKQKGNGLGLTTCYSIIQRHEGSIEAESVLGKGSVFHILLPASRRDTSIDETLPAVRHRGSGRILVMDDEPYIRELIGIILKRWGYAVIEAKDGTEALCLISTAEKSGSPIDAAIFDLTIPGGMGGKETIIALRQKWPALPVFASSGYSQDPVIARPVDFGFTDSIRKPYRKDELAALLERHLGKG
jgi:PAS domain S-box-containing protein